MFEVLRVPSSMCLGSEKGTYFSRISVLWVLCVSVLCIPVVRGRQIISRIGYFWTADFKFVLNHFLGFVLGLPVKGERYTTHRNAPRVHWSIENGGTKSSWMWRSCGDKQTLLPQVDVLEYVYGRYMFLKDVSG